MDEALLTKTKEQFEAELAQAANFNAVEELRVKYLGKKGIVRELLNGMTSLSPDEKRVLGSQINGLKGIIETELLALSDRLSKAAPKDEMDTLYKSLPGTHPDIGHLHIITQAVREIVDIFRPLGFTRVRYPEIEWDYFAFEALNMPKTHPARDDWETFFVKAPEDTKYGKMVITPHTSSGQVREMLKGELPIRMLNISRCGRRQETIRHLTTFYQFEGLVVDKGINISHLKGVTDYFVKHFFGPSREIRLRPYDFRFTEPSFEVDINCGFCLGKGCKLCKGGWMELGGAGMVHPNVLKAGNIDPSVYTGFAFGWGVERTYMMKSGTKIDDIRHLFNNDLRFLEQF